MTQQQDGPPASALFRHAPPTTTRDRLIEAAVERCYTMGFHAVGLDAICADVGISKQAFYRHFESKDALVVEAIARRDELENRTFAEMVNEGGGSARDRLLRVFDVLDRWFNHPDYEGCLFLTACHEFPNPNDPVHRAAAGHYSAGEAWIVEMAREAGAAEPERLAREFVVLIEGAVSYRLVAGDNAAARNARGVAELLLRERLPEP